MDKMAILAASTTVPSATLYPRSDLRFAISPIINFAPQVRRAIGTLSTLVFLRCFMLASIASTSLLAVATISCFRLFLLARYLTYRSAALAKFVSWKIWNSKSCRRLRKKLEYEFFVLVLGAGNTVFLIAFWPGWIIAAVAVWALWSWAG